MENHKPDKYIGSYWVGNMLVDVSIVWAAWDYKEGNTYCKREDYTQNGKHTVHIFYDEKVIDDNYNKFCIEVANDINRHNYD